MHNPHGRAVFTTPPLTDNTKSKHLYKKNIQNYGIALANNLTNRTRKTEQRAVAEAATVSTEQAAITS